MLHRIAVPPGQYTRGNCLLWIWEALLSSGTTHGINWLAQECFNLGSTLIRLDKDVLGDQLKEELNGFLEALRPTKCNKGLRLDPNDQAS